MAEKTRVDEATCDQVLDELLEQNPIALVAALGDDALYVPMPAEVPLKATQHLLRGRSTLDIAVPSDFVDLLAAWDDARTIGIGRGTMHLMSDQSRGMDATVVDVRHRCGVYVLVLVDQSGEASAVAPKEVAPSKPRVATMKKELMGLITEVDEAASLMFGWSREEMVDHRSLEFYHPDDAEQSVNSWMDMLANGASPRTRTRHLRADGSWLWVEIGNQLHFDDAGGQYVTTEFLDISSEMAAHEALRRSENLFRRLAEALPSGLFQLEPDRQIVYSNARLAEILGTPLASTVNEQLRAVIPEDREKLDGALHAVIEQGQDDNIEVHIRLPGTGERRLCTMSLRALSDDDGAAIGAIVCVDDVTDSARMRAELEVRATFDPLTECYNRASIVAVLEAALARDDGGSVGVIFADLDQFKPINDDYGHAVGDGLLKEVADRLRHTVRSDDVVGRIGGDEFLVVCRDVSGPDEAMRVAERISDALRQVVELSGFEIKPQASLGVACAGDGAVTADELVARADAAMYQSKRDAGGRPALFDGIELPPATQATPRSTRSRRRKVAAQ